MNRYIISYDLMAPHKDYTKLINAIKCYPAYVRVLNSVWVINSTSTFTQICNDLKQYMDNNDKLLVAQLTGNASWINANCTNEELKSLLN